MEFWQNIVLKWKQIQQFCLWALSSDPSGLVESGMYYNTTANRAALRDDTKTQLLAHLEDTYKNAGVIKQPTITKGTNSITVGNDAIIRCYKTTDYSGIIQEVVNPTGGTFAITQNVDQWLVYTYGLGYSIVSSIPTGSLSNIVPVFRYFNAFGVIHSSTQDELGNGAIEKTLARIAQTEYIRRVGNSGIELSTSGLNVLISGGFAYDASILETVAPFNSANNNLYRVVYDDGIWSQTTLHALTNTHYNPSTGLATLNSNKYCWAYVWRSIGDDIEAFFQLGEQEYATEELAIKDLGKMPANIFGLYATHCVLVGYVLLKQGVTTTQYFSAWGRPTVAGAPVYHNTLAGIDAGDPGTAYFGHVKLLDNTRMNAAGSANGYALLGSDGKVPSGQLPSYVDDVLEYATKANFPATGESGKIYVDLATNLTWRWSGSTYVEISPSLALGETSTTAYRGDRGKVAYDHSQITHAPANADNTQGALNAGAAKTTPVDADTMALLDSAASNSIKKLSWANVKASLKSYFDGIYSKLTLGTTSTTAARGDQGLTAYNHSQITNANPHGTTAAQIQSTATGDVGATNVQAAIAELAREKLSTSSASTTYAPINTTLADNAASSTLPTTASGSLVSKIQQIRDYLKYLLNTVNSVSGDYVSKSIGTLQTILSDLVAGESHIGSWSANTNHARFGHKDFNNAGGYGFLQSSNGYVNISAPTDTGIYFNIDHVNKVWITPDGYTHLIAPATSDDSDLAVTSAWVKDVAAPINATLTNEPGQDVLPTGTYSVVALLQWFRNNLSQLFSAVAGKAPTNHASTSTAYGRSDASNYGHAMASGATPLMNGAASAGTDNGKFAREGHVHPSDTTKAASTHTHGNISNTGAIGAASGLPVVTGTSGVLTTVAWSTTAPVMDGTAAVGTSTVPSRSDHAHPSDTSRLALGSGFSAGASVITRAYSSGNTYTNNVIYLET